VLAASKYIAALTAGIDVSMLACIPVSQFAFQLGSEWFSGRPTQAGRRVETGAGSFDADVMVVALGADLDPTATPGLVEGGHEFYTVSGAFAVRGVLEEFKGGRVIVGVTSTPFKCPPAPSETALLVDDYLTARGVREDSEVALVMSFGVPIPPSPGASAALMVKNQATGKCWSAHLGTWGSSCTWNHAIVWGPATSVAWRFTTVTSLPGQTYVVRARSYDALGNISSVVTRTVAIT
jgi:hypothetical protein